MHYHLKINNNKKGKRMKKLSLLVFVMMVTWMVTSCSTTTSNGCFGFWEDNRWGLKRGTIVGKMPIIRNLIDNVSMKIIIY